MPHTYKKEYEIYLNNKDDNVYLCAWSGGMDSTAMVYKYLEEGHKVHAHHIYMKNYQNRWEAEGKAYDALAAEFKKRYGDQLILTSSTTEHYLDWAGYDMMNAMWMMCIIAEGYLMGLNQKTINICIAEQGHFKTSWFWDQIIQRSIDLFYTYFAKLNFEPNLIMPFGRYSKDEIALMLPKEILQMCFVCYYPDENGNICGHCLKCKRMNRILTEIYHDERADFKQL